MPTEELANESRSTHITVAADMVFSLSHYLSGVLLISIQKIGRSSDVISIDCYCRFRPGVERCFLGRNPVLWIVSASTRLQLAKTCRNFILQHEPHSLGVVESVGHSRRAFQPSEVEKNLQNDLCTDILTRCAATIITMSPSLLSILFGNWQCAF
jgi:hypothetical protein